MLLMAPQIKEINVLIALLRCPKNPSKEIDLVTNILGLGNFTARIEGLYQSQFCSLNSRARVYITEFVVIVLLNFVRQIYEYRRHSKIITFMMHGDTYIYAFIKAPYVSGKYLYIGLSYKDCI